MLVNYEDLLEYIKINILLGCHFVNVKIRNAFSMSYILAFKIQNYVSLTSWLVGEEGVGGGGC